MERITNPQEGKFIALCGYEQFRYVRSIWMSFERLNSSDNISYTYLQFVKNIVL